MEQVKPRTPLEELVHEFRVWNIQWEAHIGSVPPKNYEEFINHLKQTYDVSRKPIKE